MVNVRFGAAGVINGAAVKLETKNKKSLKILKESY